MRLGGTTFTATSTIICGIGTHIGDWLDSIDTGVARWFRFCRARIDRGLWCCCTGVARWRRLCGARIDDGFSDRFYCTSVVRIGRDVDPAVRQVRTNLNWRTRTGDAGDGDELTDISWRAIERTLWFIVHHAMVLDVKIGVAIGFTVRIFWAVQVSARIPGMTTVGKFDVLHARVHGWAWGRKTRHRNEFAVIAVATFFVTNGFFIFHAIVGHR